MMIPSHRLDSNWRQRLNIKIIQVSNIISGIQAIMIYPVLKLHGLTCESF